MVADAVAAAVGQPTLELSLSLASVSPVATEGLLRIHESNLLFDEPEK